MATSGLSWHSADATHAAEPWLFCRGDSSPSKLEDVGVSTAQEPLHDQRSSTFSLISLPISLSFS